MIHASMAMDDPSNCKVLALPLLKDHSVLRILGILERTFCRVFCGTISGFRLIGSVCYEDSQSIKI